jgi:hypothetical protein
MWKNMVETIHVDKQRLLRQLRKRTIKSFMDILILSELRKTPMSGYDMISSIFSRFNLLPSSGSVYSLLYTLEREGFITGGMDRKKESLCNHFKRPRSRRNGSKPIRKNRKPDNEHICGRFPLIFKNRT